MSAAALAPSRRTLTPIQAILLATLVIGILDATDGVIAYWLAANLNPIQVLQFIASGVLGQPSFQGGLPTAMLGLILHFFISFVVAGIYVLASQRVPALKEHAVPFGLAFGAAVYLVMTFVVLPLSAVPPQRFSLPTFLNGVIGHALFVGLPAALFARRVSAHTN